MRVLTVVEADDVSGGFIMVACAIAGVLVAAFAAGVALGAAADQGLTCRPKIEPM